MTDITHRHRENEIMRAGGGKPSAFCFKEERQMKWEKSSELIKEEGEPIAAVFGASSSNVYNSENVYRNARLAENAPELKTCPFCGGEAEVYIEGDEPRKWFYVRCIDCWAQTDGNDTEIGARDAWNQRKNTR